MKRIINDYKREEYSPKECVLYGILYPSVLIAACFLAEMLMRW